MRKTEALSVKEIMEDYLKSRNMEGRLLERQALELWPMIVGNAINRATVERRVDNGVMSIRITSAPMRSELQMHRTALIASINKELGKDVIKEIRFI